MQQGSQQLSSRSMEMNLEKITGVTLQEVDVRPQIARQMLYKLLKFILPQYIL